MRAAARLVVFATTAAAAFGAAFAAGAVTEPVSSPEVMHEAAEEGGPARPTVPSVLPSGLGVADRGYTLHVADVTLPRGDQVLLGFRITGPDGAVVRRYRTTHEKDMHLILVRRDLSSFQHLHPAQDAGGTWTTTADLSAAGTYRLFADFVPADLGEEALTLGADVSVPGPFEAAEPPAASTSSAADGYEVTLAAQPRAGEEASLEFTVRRDGVPVTDLEPYLGASGHLVALRYGDLAYLHTHSLDGLAAPRATGPVIRFAATFPTPGSYRLFLNFAHAGQTRTAAFTVDLPASTSPGPPPAPVPAPSGGAPLPDPGGAGHGGH